MRTPTVRWLGVAPALLLLACESDAPPECVSVGDCPGARTCFDGRCLVACVDDGPCRSNEVCRVGVCQEGRRAAGDPITAGDPVAGDPRVGDPGHSAGDDAIAGDTTPGGDVAGDAGCAGDCLPGPVDQGEDLTPNTGGAMAAGTLQVALIYDGNDTNPTVTIELEERDYPANTTTLVLGGITPGDGVTREIALGAWQPTGRIQITGTSPNGVIDGIGIGMFWKGRDLGKQILLRSYLPTAQLGADFVGMWPFQVSAATWTSKTPQLSSEAARRQARALLYASELVLDGNYDLMANALGGAIDSGSPPDSTHGPIVVGDDLTSNRNQRLPNDRLQLVVYYDGVNASAPTLVWSCTESSTGDRYAVTVSGIPNSKTDGTGEILTREYDLRDCPPNGRIEISGVVLNGGDVDGVAVGMFWQDSGGYYRIARSNESSSVAGWVGMWPLDLTDAQIKSQLTQVTDSYARDQAFATIMGARCLLDGSYTLVTH